MRDAEVVPTSRVPPASTDPPVDSLPTRGLHRHIEEAILAFGQDVLTAREQAVVQLILRGLSSKVVAGELRIALKTEKVHRRNAYAKLGVNSHAVLFSRFLQFLSATLEVAATYEDERACDADAGPGRERGRAGRYSARCHADRQGPAGPKHAGATADAGHLLRDAVLRNARYR